MLRNSLAVKAVEHLADGVCHVILERFTVRGLTICNPSTAAGHGFREVVDSHLPEAVFRIPEATYLGWVDIGAYVEEGENLPLLFAEGAGVLLEGGNMFVQNSDTYIRLNVACPRSVLEEGMRRICSLLTERRKQYESEGSL